MIDKDIENPAETADDKPAELSDAQIEDAAGGARPSQTVYAKKGVKFE